MCENCLTTYALANKLDPTRTTSLRNAFEKQMNKRFDKFMSTVKKAIMQDDVFGLYEPKVNIDPGHKAFAFPTSEQKVSAFMAWLKELEEQEILEIGRYNQLGASANNAWTNMYVKDSYQRGIQKARYEMKKAGYNVLDIHQSGGIGAVMGTPFHMDRVGLLYTRTFNDLVAITDAMNSQISRVLSEGMMEGNGPLAIARKLNAVVTGAGDTLAITDTLGRFIPAKRRAQMLARTEIIRAHHKATIQEYRNWGVEGVNVEAEWVTAGDSKVCPICEKIAKGGKNKDGVYSLDEVENMLPVHPNCRCSTIPAKVKKEEGKDIISKDEETPYSNSTTYYNKKELYRGDIRDKGDKFTNAKDYIMDGEAKNKAGFHWFSDKKDLAMEYATKQQSVLRGGIEKSVLTTIKTDNIKILDFDKMDIKNQVLFMKDMDKLGLSDLMYKQELLKNYKGKFTEEALSKYLGYNTRGGILPNGQILSDGDKGVLFKKWLINNGFDGYRFKLFEAGADIGLVNSNTFSLVSRDFL